MGVDWGDYFGTEDPDEIDAIMCEYDYYDPEDDIRQVIGDIKEELGEIYKRYENGWFYKDVIYSDYSFHLVKLRAPKKSKRVMKAEKRKERELKKRLEWKYKKLSDLEHKRYIHLFDPEIDNDDEEEVPF